MEEMFLAVLVLLLVATPLAVIGLALTAYSRANAARKELERLGRRVDELARRVEGRAVAAAPAPPASPVRPETGADRSLEASALEPRSATPSAEPSPPPTAGSFPEEPPPLPRRLPAPPTTSAATPVGAPRPAAPKAREPQWDLEKLLGGSLLVWIGGVALALAAAFFVKYSFEQGWVSPPIRIGGGLAFGLALIGLGEWLRSRSAHVAQAACAAGVASLFAALLAGTNLYALIPPVLGFAGLALTTGAAVALSLRHGPFVAGLGLLGGFLTPALIRVDEPSPPLFFGYLFALQLGLLFVARRRGWWPVGLLSILGTQGWALAWLADLPTGPREPFLGLFVLAATAAAVLVAVGAGAREDWGRTKGRDVAPWLGITAAVLGLAVLAATVHAGAFSNMEWGFLALLAAGGLVLARFDRGYEALPWLTAAAGAVLLLDWSNGATPTGARFAWIGLAFGAVHAAGAWLVSRVLEAPTRLAALSASATVAYLLVAWAELPDPPGPGPWGFVAVALAVLHAAALALELRGRAHAGALSAHAVAATALVSLALAFEVRSESIAVAWALELPALALIHERLRLRALRPLAAVVAVASGLLLLLNPETWEQDAGPIPVVDWLAWGFGVPCLAFAAAAVLFRRRGDDDGLVAGLEGGASALGAAWLLLEIRALFHDGRFASPELTLAELGCLVSGWLLLGACLCVAAHLRERVALGWSGLALGALAALGLVLGLLLGQNPLWAPVEVAGPRLANTLLVAYLLPALLLAAWSLPRLDLAPLGARLGAGALSLVTAFAFVTLQVRHWFHAPRLDSGRPDDFELYAYSASWILFGVGLLVGGLRTGSKVLRQAALAVMLVAVAKVFLFDMQELTDLWRVLSFLGLGLSLLGLGFLYQRFVLHADEG